MRSELLIQREYPDQGTAEIVMRSLLPDNRGVPLDTDVEMWTSGKKLMVRVTSTDDLRSFLRTIDDILSCLQTSERALASLGGEGDPDH